MNDCSVQPLALGHAAFFEAVAELSIRAWGREPRPGELRDRTKRLDLEVASANPDTKCLFIARHGEEVCGFARAGADQRQPDVWWLMGIVVSPEHRRKGVARALTHACVQYAKVRGSTTLRSETHVDNVASIRFHEAFGFRNTGEFVADDGDHKVGFLLVLR